MQQWRSRRRFSIVNLRETKQNVACQQKNDYVEDEKHFRWEKWRPRYQRIVCCKLWMVWEVYVKAWVFSSKKNYNHSERSSIGSQMGSTSTHILVTWNQFQEGSLSKVFKAWQAIPAETVANSMKACGLSLPVDGSKDDMISGFKEGKSVLMAELCCKHKCKILTTEAYTKTHSK